MSEFWVLTKYKLHVRHYLFDTERVIPEQVIQKKNLCYVQLVYRAI